MADKTKYEVRHTSQFKKDYRQAIKRKHELSELHKIVDYLANGIPLSPEYKDHELSGNWKIIGNVI